MNKVLEVLWQESILAGPSSAQVETAGKIMARMESIHAIGKLVARLRKVKLWLIEPSVLDRPLTLPLMVSFWSRC